MTRRLLVAYSMASAHVQTTMEYLLAAQRYSGYETDYLHVTHGARVKADFDSYDIVFHSYCARWIFDGYVSDSYRDALRRFTGLKVLAVQDEYDATNKIKAAIRDVGFNVVLTCVPDDQIEKVYPRSELADVAFINVYTGYVPEDLAATSTEPKALRDRPILLGYRGRDIGARYGRLGFEKYEVGRAMKAFCDSRNVATDIAMDEASRIYGPAWLEFVGNCRAMLGSESGSNVFDFDGAIQKRFDAMRAANPGNRPPSHDAFKPYVEKLDRDFDIGQISPRVFECAVMRTPMVLIRGRYSGAIQPDAHYIPLEKDFSNAGEVLARLDDVAALEAMSDRTYDHLVASKRFGYQAFWAMLHDRFEKALTTPHITVHRTPVRSARRFAMFRETPTRRPQSLPGYQNSHLYLSYMSRRMPAAFGVLQKGWHLMPQHVRDRFIQVLTRVR